MRRSVISQSVLPSVPETPAGIELGRCWSVGRASQANTIRRIMVDFGHKSQKKNSQGNPLRTSSSFAGSATRTPGRVTPLTRRVMLARSST